MNQVLDAKRLLGQGSELPAARGILLRIRAEDQLDATQEEGWRLVATKKMFETVLIGAVVTSGILSVLLNFFGLLTISAGVTLLSLHVALLACLTIGSLLKGY